MTDEQGEHLATREEARAPVQMDERGRGMTARLAVALLAIGPDADGPSVGRSVCNAINSDARVTRIDVPDLAPDWTGVYSRGYPPAGPASSQRDVVLGTDEIGILQLDRPIAFHVHVPSKNQRRIHADDEVPEEYEVVWNGVALIVGWLERPGASRMSGGHVVLDILRTACEQVPEVELYVQGCSPECSYQFAHADMWVWSDESVSSTGVFSELRRGRVGIALAAPWDLELLAWELFHVLEPSAMAFAYSKNLARRLLDLDAIACASLGQLLQLQLMDASVAALPFRKRVQSRWSHKGHHHRRRSKELAASLWMILSSMQALEVELRNHMLYLEEYQQDTAGVESVFEGDFRHDRAAIAGRNTDVTRTALEQAAARLDTRTLTNATVWAGLAGGILGLGAGAVLQ